jgi:hypothetical protein
MLADPKYGVVGLTLPGGGLIRDQTFADDTALYLRGQPKNLDRAKGVLRIFCQASGAKINWHKSAAIWASARERTWTWGDEVRLKWIPTGQGTWYLGIQVGFRLPTKANFDALMVNLKAKLIGWSHSSLSLAGRVLVSNQVLLASLWYIASCWNPNPIMCNQVRGIIRNFIWGEGCPRTGKSEMGDAGPPNDPGGTRRHRPQDSIRSPLGEITHKRAFTWRGTLEGVGSPQG